MCYQTNLDQQTSQLGRHGPCDRSRPLAALRIRKTSGKERIDKEQKRGGMRASADMTGTMMVKVISLFEASTRRHMRLSGGKVQRRTLAGRGEEER